MCSGRSLSSDLQIGPPTTNHKPSGSCHPEYESLFSIFSCIRWEMGESHECNKNWRAAARHAKGFEKSTRGDGSSSSWVAITKRHELFNWWSMNIYVFMFYVTRWLLRRLRSVQNQYFDRVWTQFVSVFFLRSRPLRRTKTYLTKKKNKTKTKTAFIHPGA